MTLFYYPKDKHARSLNPPKYKRYQSYKRHLQVEFSRVCVYCRQPDSTVPNLNFGVDHYRPSSKFPQLLRDYSNLFYCCGSCNSRKRQYWPLNEKVGPYIVDPCGYKMADHLRFDPHTGKIEHKGPHGKHTVDLLQLNDAALVTFRKSQSRTTLQRSASVRYIIRTV